MQRYDDEIPEPELVGKQSGSLAWRSLILPAAASAIIAMGFGAGIACERGPGAWLLLAAPAFATIGAVAGPMRTLRDRLLVGLLSTAVNLTVMLAAGMVFGWFTCGR
ncbi:hypothetical protein [Emcibacter sp. SYSU 3D8]|uniref:hypothetical protein n=1 Tax=Emcibacter sp. SYSU 3D8 TaxID=3133969 RepID=UPI0031FE64A1